MKPTLTDLQCNKILEMYPTIPKSHELYSLMRLVFRTGRDSDLMKVTFKKEKAE